MIASGLVMLISIAGAVVAVGVKNIVHAIFGLGISLAGLALAFLFLGTPFVATMQVLIYIGGITIAMVFAVMLSSMGRRESDGSIRRRALAAGVSIVFFIAMASILVGADFGEPSQSAIGALSPEEFESAWSVKAIGRELLDHYNVAFELLSVVLLLAIVGAITIASRHDHGPDPVFEEECDQ